MFLRFANNTASADAGTGSGAGARGSARRSVNGPRGLLAAPAQIMGPRLLFILAVVLLCGMGLVMVYSSSSILALNSEDYGYDATFFLKRQLVFLVAGIFVCIACAAIPYRFWSRKPVFIALWLVTCVTLGATAFGFGVSELGAERSIVVAGFALQPAEFGKIAVLLTCASLVEMQREVQWSFPRFMLVFAVAALVPLLLIYRQPDLGTAIILAVGLLALMFLVGFPLYSIGIVVLVMVVYVIYACVTQPYHMERIVTMFDPWLDPQGNGYQSIQSLYAFGSGGIFGTGLGLSRQKYLYLPYAHTDFIFAVIGEELGLFGAVFTVALFGLFIFAGMRICRSAPDVFGASVVGSMTVMVGFQACVNMMCVSGIAPVTGKALPFISYGGSSLVATMIMVGIILSVSLRSKVGVTAELRRDNLFVIDGGAGRAVGGGSAGSRAAAAAGGVGASGLRVIEGFRGRFSREEAPARERHAGSERSARSGRTVRAADEDRAASTTRGGRYADADVYGRAAGSPRSASRRAGTRGGQGRRTVSSPRTSESSRQRGADLEARGRNSRRGTSGQTRSGYGADLRVKDDLNRKRR